MRRYFVGLLAVIGITGCLLQAIRKDQQAPFWTYFTVWSDIALVTGALVSENRCSRTLERGGTAVILLSALAYWSIIAPNIRPTTPVGWMATLCLHLLSPVIAITILVVGASRALLANERWYIYIYPVAYLIVVVTAQQFGSPSPYRFLSIRQTGPLMVLISVLIASLLYALIGHGISSYVDGRASDGSHPN